ncbi:hypothetical protein VL20_2325 [Microcystis panniformis FACHB-1757]|uniref:Uncharacterized protein n=1 Tax=Microcystis panniformis FACHB-1757 TaxID=1638788 RepID=A0A0K1S084_9CHRO|nr:hypothetical protein VL20_2325 [Microcystis panniformis FACHB-1757]
MNQPYPAPLDKEGANSPLILGLIHSPNLILFFATLNGL